MSSTLDQNLILTVIVGMALANYCLRFVPMAALSRITLPEPIMRWLSYVPISVMGALFAKEVLLPALDATDTFPVYLNPGIYGALCAMLTFRLTKSFMGSALAGVGFFLLARWGFSLL